MKGPSAEIPPRVVPTVLPVMTTLNSVCDTHGHDPGLPDERLRAHVLAIALRAAEAALAAHRYAEVERSAEVIHTALEDALDDVETRTPTRSTGRAEADGG